MEKIDADCFPNINNKVPTNFYSVLSDSAFTVIVGSLNDDIIAKTHIRWNEKNTFLSDIGVLSSHRNTGYGADMLAYCIHYIFNQKPQPIHLDVLSKNGAAISLYTRNGFVMHDQHDYWEFTIPKLQQCLNQKPTPI